MAEPVKRQSLKKFDRIQEVKTYKVGNAIAEIVKKERVFPASIDFDIRQVNTFIREPGQDEYNALNEVHLKNLSQETYLLSERLKITQEYVVKFKPTKQDPDFRPVISIATDPMKSIAKAVVKRNSIFKPTDDLKKRLVDYFNKVKVKNHMLIEVNDQAMLKSIDTLVAKVQSGGLTADLVIWLAKWPKAVPPKDDAIELLYREKNKKNKKDSDKVDHAERDFIIGVEKDEILVVYHKARNGRPGRNFSGTYISVEEPKIVNLPPFEPDPTSIILEDSQDKKIYKSSADGFVSIEMGLLTVQQEMLLKNVTLKETGNVRPGLDSKVKIRVESGDPAEDAVGPDMIIEATEITVVGSIGSGAVLRAKKITVNGQTHTTTKLYAEDLEVGVLKGYAECNIGNVKSIEQGTIYGDNVSIETVTGGEIYGRRVEIKDLRLPAKIYAAQAVLIENQDCAENKIYLDQTAILTARKAINTAKQDIKDSNNYIKIGTDEVVKVSKFLRDNKQTFENIKVHIMECKQRGDAPKSTFVKMFKDYLAKMKSLDELHKKLEEAEEKIEKSRDFLQDLDGELMTAFVFNEGLKWQGRNEIHFIFHGKVLDANKVIDGFPAAEIVGVKLTERDGLSAVVGLKEEFPKIDIYTEQPFDYKNDPLAEKDEEEKSQEEDALEEELPEES